MNDVDQGECIEARGPFPFVTHRLFRLADQSIMAWSSRHHRKGLALPERAIVRPISAILWRSLWLPCDLNWWIGIIFAVGASLFALASAFALQKSIDVGVDTINATYFAGSIPFTVAAYLQVWQSANRDRSPRGKVRWLGWQPTDLGWLSCVLQFVGTLAFNVNTFDAMTANMSWLRTDILVWIPNAVGSVLFLASGYLAFIETCHAYWGWQPRSLSWWIVAVNLIGCIGFLISAALSISLPNAYSEAALWATAFTLVGALCFLIGALLLLPETAVEEESPERG